MSNETQTTVTTPESTGEKKVKPSKSVQKRVKVQKDKPTLKVVKPDTDLKTAAQKVADRIASINPDKGETKEVVPVSPKLPVLSSLQIAIRDARTLHRRMKADFIDGLAQIAQQVLIAKIAAKKEGVRFETLFGDTDDQSKFPFSQNWANTIVRVYESKLLSGDVSKLPSDLTTLATLASTKPEQREAVLKRYEEIRTGDYNVIEGEIVLAKVTTQKAMKKAKRDVTGEEEDVTPEKPKHFNATRMAKMLLRELGPDGLTELAEAIEIVLADTVGR